MMWTLDAGAATSYTTNVVAPSVSKQGASQTSGIIAQRVANTVGGSGLGGGTGTFGTTNTSSLTPSKKTAHTGEAAGDAPVGQRPSLWISAAVSSVDKSDRGGEFDGQIYTGLIGLDKLVSDRLLLGAAIGTEALDIKTAFNNGTVTSSSFAFAPYGAFKLNEDLTLVASLGASRHWYDIARSNGAITGSTTGTRYFNSLDLTTKQASGAWRMSGGIGNLWLFERQKAYRESNGTQQGKTDIRLGQASLTGRLGRAFDRSFGTLTPYLSARAEYDYSRTAGIDLGNGATAADDRFGMVFGLGLDTAIADNISLDVSGTMSALRENLEVYTGTMTFRIRF